MNRAARTILLVLLAAATAGLPGIARAQEPDRSQEQDAEGRRPRRPRRAPRPPPERTREIEEADPDDDEIGVDYLAHGKAAEERGDLEVAEIWYRRASRQNAFAKEPRYRLAQVLAWSRQFDRALAQFERILQIYPDEFRALMGVARMLAWMGEYDAALEHYEAIYENHPDRPEVMLQIAQVQKWRRHFRESEIYYLRYEPHASNRADVYVRLGELAYWQRQYSRAIRFYETALEIEAGRLDALRGRERVRQALDTEIRLEMEYSVVKQDHDWTRYDLEVSAWPHHVFQIGARVGHFRRFGREEEQVAGFVAVEFPFDIQVRGGAGGARRAYTRSTGEESAVFLPTQRYFASIKKRFPPQGVDYWVSYERDNFGGEYVDIWVPVGLNVRTFRPMELTGEYFVVSDLQRRLVGAAWGQASYFITEDHSVHIGGFTGLDTNKSFTRAEIETDRVLGLFVGGVARVHRHIGIKADIRMQYRRGESIQSLWHAFGTRYDFGMVLFVHF